MRKVKPGEMGWMGGHSGERAEFAEFYKELDFGGRFLGQEQVICNGPITYIGQKEVANDTALFKRSLAEAGSRVEETFLCVLAPGWLGADLPDCPDVPGGPAGRRSCERKHMVLDRKHERNAGVSNAGSAADGQGFGGRGLQHLLLR